jgi:hypothetical protein
MKRSFTLALAPALLIAAAPALRAQSPNWGLALSMGVPVGDFREKTFAPTEYVDER